MSITYHHTTDSSDPADFIVLALLEQLRQGRRVLFFVTGGSSISVGVKVAEQLRAELDQDQIKNLTIALTDERYGALDHPDSNWHQLIQKGFSLPGANIIPVLIWQDHKTTTDRYNSALYDAYEKSQYKMALFGIGADGHISGVLPGSVAVHSPELVVGYDTPQFSRITTTLSAIGKLDQAIVFTQGENKWSVLANLEKDIDLDVQPANVLQKVSDVHIFSDYKL